MDGCAVAVEFAKEFANPDFREAWGSTLLTLCLAEPSLFEDAAATLAHAVLFTMLDVGAELTAVIPSVGAAVS